MAVMQDLSEKDLDVRLISIEISENNTIFGTMLEQIYAHQPFLASFDRFYLRLCLTCSSTCQSLQQRTA